MADEATEATETTIDTSNDYVVGVLGGSLVVMLPVKGNIPKDKALRLAAWIVALADLSEDHAEFNKVLEAIENV